MYAKLEKTWGLLDRAAPAALGALHIAAPARHTDSPLLKWMPLTLGVAAAIAIGLFVTNPVRGPQAFAESLATSMGGFTKKNLPDGSIIRLNTDSALEIAYTATERRVRLHRGEAGFAVAKDPERPFIVRVGSIDVRALGTAINVRLEPGRLEVLVTEGRVGVEDAINGGSLLEDPAAQLATNADVTNADPERIAFRPEPPVLTAGQRAILSQAALVETAKAVVAPVTREDITRALAWQQRRLNFTDEPLENIVAEFNRYSHHKLIVADPRLAAQRFGGKFPADDCDSLVRMLEENFGVLVERTETETVLHLRR
jgi:transmembrane sensor